MKHLTSLFMCLVVATLMLAFSTKPVMAQEKAKTDKDKSPAQGAKKEWPPPGPTSKVLLENEKVRVQELTSKPGEKTKMTERKARIVYYIQGGPTKVYYPDGKTENSERKTATAEYFPSGDTKSTENVGKSDHRFILINLE